MKFLKLLLLTFTLMTWNAIWSQGLDDYIWENRLLIFVAKSSESSALQKNLSLFTEKQTELNERNLLLLTVTPEETTTIGSSTSNLKADTIYRQLNLKSDYEGVLLIGKDGGVKFKKPFQVEPEIIFNKIDGMPMRQSEIRNRKD